MIILYVATVEWRYTVTFYLAVHLFLLYTMTLLYEGDIICRGEGLKNQLSDHNIITIFLL